MTSNGGIALLDEAIATRVNYVEGQVMAAPDLVVEQAYLISMRQKHAIASHRWGIVRGLEPVIAGTSLQVSSGVAVDGFGRYLIVTDPVTTDLSNVTADSVLIWLAYSLDPTGNAPAGQNTRWIESTHLRLEPGTMTSPRQTEDTATDWPVLLGVLERSSANTPYRVNVSARPRISPCGESITAASGAAQVRLGPDFAVGLHGAQDKPRFTDKLRINSAGDLTITANSSFMGDVVAQTDATLAPSGLAGLGFAGSIDMPKSPNPWKIYRTILRPNPDAPKPGPAQNVLIMEVPQEDDNNPGGITAAIGRAADGKFQPCLSVSPSGDVTIRGVVRVQGLLYEGPIAADPSDPRFLVSLANAAAGATADTGPGPLAVEVGGQPQSKVGDVPYSLAFTNNGTVPVRIVQVQEIFTLDGGLIAGPAKPIDPFHVAAGKTETIDRIETVQQTGKLAIGIRVLGAAPDGSPLTAKDAMFIQVID
jgi:hypothetical protein